MPKKVNEMTALAVKKLQKDGKYFVGGVPGLVLFIKKGNGFYRLSYYFGGKRKEISIGPRSLLTLSEARIKALEYKKMLFEGKDPSKEKAKIRQQQKAELVTKQQPYTFAQVAEKWIVSRREANYWRHDATGEKHTHAAFIKHVFPVIGNKSIEEICAEDIKNLLIPIWQTHPNVAKKVLSWTRAVFRWAIATGIRKKAENPASLENSLGVLLEPYSKNQKEAENFAALPFKQIPDFMVHLSDLTSMSADMLKLSILLAVRSKALRLAKWEDLDLANKILLVRLENDKFKSLKRNRTIYLSDAAVKIFKSLPRFEESPYIFCNPYGKPYSEACMMAVIRQLHKSKLQVDGIGWIDPQKSERQKKPCIISQHGTARSTFRTWAKDDVLGNNKKFDQEAVEMCLLHSKKDYLRGAYDRAALEQERRRIMEEWGTFCMSKIQSEK